MFSNLVFTWPGSLAQVHNDCMTALSSAAGELASAGGRLAAAPALEVINNPVAASAAGTGQMLADLIAQTLASVTLVCVHPWCQGVGQGDNHYRYLSPANAVIAAANKFADVPDTHKPAGAVDALVLVVSAKSFDDFAKTLKPLNSVFPVADLQLCERRASQLATVERDKQVLPDAAINARWHKRGLPGIGRVSQAAAVVGELCAHASGYEAAGASPDEEINALIAKKSAALSTADNAITELQAVFAGGSGRGVFFQSTTPAQIKNALANSGLSHDDPVAVCLVLAGAVGSLDVVREMLGL